RHRLGPGSGGRPDAGYQVPADQPADGCCARPEGVHRGGARRHRQHHRRDDWRLPAGHYGDHDRRFLPGPRRLPRRFCVHHPDPRPAVPPDGYHGRSRAGEGIAMSTTTTTEAGKARRSLRLSRNQILTGIALLVFVGFLIWAQNNLDPYKLRILNLCAVYTIFAVTFNLIFGYTGQLSLGHAGFAAVGAYTAALLTLSVAQKQANFFLAPIIPLLANVEWGFLPAVLVAGVLAAVTGLLIGWPALRLRGDYLAIATLGFGEIIRVMFVNWQRITNGSLGLKGIPGYTNLYWSWGFALITIFVVKKLVDSSYGRALKSIRDDEVAAQALGINLARHKLLAFTLSSFFVGIGGALLANLIST